MVSPRIESLFPRLRREGYQITSPADDNYNCIAWAAEDTTLFWWPDSTGTCFWPDEVDREETMEAFIKAYGILGYVPCIDERLEDDFEKIAIYTKAGRPKHAARQLSNGLWTSKLGELEDIEHPLPALEGVQYGKVSQILQRPRRK